MSNTDELTKIYNRHAFESHVHEIEEKGIGEDLWYINFDLNGLKETNDTKGHIAGDELIIAMANCIDKSVSNFGKAYRIGGDEFVAVLRCSDKEIKKVLLGLEDLRSEWHGKYSSELSFSKGVVCSVELQDCSMADLEKEADRRMYKEKKKYHILN